MNSLIRNISFSTLLLPVLAACAQGGGDGDVARTGSVESDGDTTNSGDVARSVESDGDTTNSGDVARSVESDGDTTSSQESPDVGTNGATSDPGPASDDGNDDAPPESHGTATPRPTMAETPVRADAGTSAEPVPSADGNALPDSGGMTGDVADAGADDGSDAGPGEDIAGFDDFILRSEVMHDYEGLTVSAYFDHNVNAESLSDIRSAVVDSGAFELHWPQRWDRNTFGAYAFLFVDLDGDSACTGDDPAWRFFVNNDAFDDSEPQVYEFVPTADEESLGCDEFEAGLPGG